jgi:hypothetical protein
MERNNLIRAEILFQLYALRLPLTASQIHRECRKRRLDYTLTEIQAEQRFLRSDAMIEHVANPGSTEQAYDITATGVRHYEQTYAA